MAIDGHNGVSIVRDDCYSCLSAILKTMDIDGWLAQSISVDHGWLRIDTPHNLWRPPMPIDGQTVPNLLWWERCIDRQSCQSSVPVVNNVHSYAHFFPRSIIVAAMFYLFSVVQAVTTFRHLSRCSTAVVVVFVHCPRYPNTSMLLPTRYLHIDFL